MRTLLLDVSAWDLVLTASGNIAVADNPYSMAQDAASAVRTFRGEVYYDTLLGMPWFQSILGKFPNAQVIKASAVAQAFTVPGVVNARCFLTNQGNRELGGQIQVQASPSTSFVAAPISLSPLPPIVKRRGQFDFSKTVNSSLVPVT